MHILKIMYAFVCSIWTLLFNKQQRKAQTLEGSWKANSRFTFSAKL